jgi:hypothetical protein
MAKTDLNYLFITGMGRSGTTFLADLLNKIDGVSAGHERIGNREYWLLSWYLGSNYSVPFLNKEKQVIDQQQAGAKMYVDVNSYLQNSTSELKTVFGTENVLHLVRDPKEVVRSIYTRRNDFDIHLLPKSEKEVSEWLAADRFFQVCKNWQLAMDQLVGNGIPVIQFEKITSDFAYLKQYLLEPYGLNLTESRWNETRTKKANKTPKKAYRFLYAKVKGKQFQPDELSKFDTWPAEYQQIFNDLCKDYSVKLGY